MTENVDATDALQSQLEEATSAGNMELASSLYRKQQGTTDPYGLEAPVPAAEGSDADQEERNKELVRREALVRKAGVAGF